MPKLPPRQALDELVSLIATHPHGIGLEALREAQGGKIARRTLQRWLALLVRDGRIAREGIGRAIKYRLVPITGKFNAILEDVTLSATRRSNQVLRSSTPLGATHIITPTARVLETPSS